MVSRKKYSSGTSLFSTVLMSVRTRQIGIELPQPADLFCVGVDAQPEVDPRGMFHPSERKCQEPQRLAVRGNPGLGAGRLRYCRWRAGSGAARGADENVVHMGRGRGRVRRMMVRGVDDGSWRRTVSSDQTADPCRCCNGKRSGPLREASGRLTPRRPAAGCWGAGDRTAARP